MSDLNIIRPKELSKIFSVSLVTIWRWEKAGNIPPRRKFHPGCVGWLEDELEEYLRSKPYADEELQEA